MANPRLDFLLLGVFGIIAVYHGFLFVLRNDRRAPLFLALFCLLMCLRLFAVNGYLSETFPDHINPIFVLKLERLAGTLAVLVFAYYLHHLMPDVIPPPLVRTIAFACLPFVGFALLPDSLYLEWKRFHELFEYATVAGLIVVTALLLRRALQQRDSMAGLLLFGFLLLACAATAQMLAGRGWIAFGNYFQIGGAAFILVQVLAIARENSLERDDSPEREDNHAHEATTARHLLAFKERGGHHMVLPLNEIVYLSSHKDSTVIHGILREHETIALLKDMQARLPENRFARIHKQYLVNLDKIERMEYMAGGNYMLTLKDSEETRLPVGRTHAPTLKKRLGLSGRK